MASARDLNRINLDTQPVTALSGVGQAQAIRLQRLGIRRTVDLLLHRPSGYQDRTRVTPIGRLRPGITALVAGEIQAAEVRRGRRRMLLLHLHDGTGAILVRFFHFRATQQQRLTRGVRLRCFGEVRRGPGGLEIVHPEYQIGGETTPESSLTPIYPATEGLHQNTLRRLIDAALSQAAAADRLTDFLAEESLDPALPALGEALRMIHRPAPGEANIDALREGNHPAVRRLAVEELIAHQLSLKLVRQRVAARRAPVIAPPGVLAEAFTGSLPYVLTEAQQRATAEVQRDMAQGRPMQRLVQGDVGSGKTVVAALAALTAVEAGYQAAVMAPTELLAEQHQRNLAAWLQPLDVTVARLAGSQRGRARDKALEQIADGTAHVVIGTHALIQPEVGFHRLGLIVIDEQHRFGVGQRLALSEKGASDEGIPHQLIMTATPIPRTLTMTAYADLDHSVIDELPPGRTPVETVAIPDSRRPEVVERIRAACREGRQAYWLCTLVEDSDALQAEAATETAQRLGEALPELRIGLVHGRLKAADKDQVMGAFQRGELDLLVTTTVIEVGVDVPNASLMIIENAERLGLSQLHQLRGRVGRGTTASACVLMYHPPLGELARARLHAMRETTDGFKLAQRDLELRGPGEILGTRQAGHLNLRVADLARDRALLPQVTRTANRLLAARPDAVTGLIRRWLGEEGLRFAEA